MVKTEKEDLKNQIVEVLRRKAKYLSVNFLANELDVHWTHAQAGVFELEREGKIKTMRTSSGFFAILKAPENPLTCGGCRYYDKGYCKLIGNYDVRRDHYTVACKQALPKNIGGEKIVR